MVGILCAARREGGFAAALSDTLQAELSAGRCSAAVFTMKNLNLTERTVFGALVGPSGVSTGRAPLPGVILNFSVQHAWNDIRKLHALKEAAGTTLYNPANTFEQRAMYEMLAAARDTAAYVLPSEEITKKDLAGYEFSGDFLLRPLKGLDTEKLFYAHQTAYGYDLYNGAGGPYARQYEIRDALAPLAGASSIILRTPELLLDGGALRMVRGYLRRSPDGAWQIVLRTLPGQGGRVYRTAGGKTDMALLRVARTLSRFMPALLFCTEDLVFSRDGAPYFAGLGGWVNIMSSRRRSGPLVFALGRSVTELSAVQGASGESE